MIIILNNKNMDVIEVGCIILLILIVALLLFPLPPLKTIQKKKSKIENLSHLKTSLSTQKCNRLPIYLLKWRAKNLYNIDVYYVGTVFCGRFVEQENPPCSDSELF